MKLTLNIIILSALLFHTVTAAAGNTVSGKDTVTADDYYIEGVREYCAGNYAKADSLFSRCAELDPNNDAVWYYRGMIKLGTSDTDKTLMYLDRAAGLSPDNPWYRLAVARLYADMGETDKAISAYDTLIAANPGKSSYYYELADLLLRNGELDKAIVTLDRIDQLRGPSEITANARYQIYLMQNKYSEAEAQALKMDEDFPSPETAMVLGDLYKTRYNDSTALFYYEKAASLDPGFSPAYFGMADIYRIQRNFYKFFKNINIFLSDSLMNPLMKTSYIQEVVFPSGMVQLFRPQVDTMIVNTLNAHPADTAVLSMAGSYFIALDSTETGLSLLRRNVELHPGIESVRMTYIGQLYYMQDWDEMIPFVQETIGLFPEHFTLYELIAIAYWQKGDYDQAVSTYRKLLRLTPEGHPILLNCYGALGDLYHEMGNSRKSYYYYNKGLKIDDNYSPILNNYAYYLSEEGRQLKKALEMSRKAVLNEPENSTYLDTYGWLLFLTGDYQEAKKYLEKAKIYGGDESAVILDHYAEALFALKEYNLAFLYWGNADKLDPDMGISEKIKERREEINRK